MHRPVVQRLWRGRIALLIGLCGCAQAASGPSVGQEKDKMPGGGEQAAMAGPKLAVAANEPSTLAPVDAAPSPDGSRIYYLAVSNDGSDHPSAGVYTVATDAQGKGETEELTLGAPLLTPVGIESSLDGKSLFIADTSSGDDATGSLFRLAASGGAPTVISGSEGYRPAGVVAGKHQGEEVLYFTGRDPQSGVGSVYRIASAGGEARRLASFDADSEPGGVAIAANGDVYVADHAGGNARVLRVRDDKTSVLVTNIGLGFPAGVALLTDDSTLLVSGLDAQTKHDVVYAITLANNKLARVEKGISGFSESAGLHRAHDVNVFAWADSQANDWGTVYSVKF